MIGLEIFIHSFRQITGNIAMAVRVSWWLVALIVLEMWLLFSDAGSESQGGGVLMALLIVAIFIFIIWGGSLVSIVWHRYILLGEIPSGLIPYRVDIKVWNYFLNAFAIAIILLAVAFVAGLLIGIVIRPDTPLKQVILGLFTGIIATALFYRMALILPAIALKKTMKISEAFEVTKKFIPPILALVVATVVFNLGANTLIDAAFGITAETRMIDMTEQGIVFNSNAGNLPLYLFVTGVLQWFVFMLNISILTTLYGHIVEKREIF